MVSNLLKLFALISAATIICFFATSSIDYYITNFATSEQKLLIMHNEYRSKKDLGTLSTSSTLNDFAKKHAINMLNRKRLVHSNLAFPGAYKAENIGYSSTDSPELIFKQWIRSRLHRSNIEFILYKRIGIGVDGNDKNGYYYCVVFSD